MKKMSVVALALLGMAILARGPTSAQTFQNGPYYGNPSWDQQIPAAQRFIVLSNWNNEAVLDRETGLVWERSPVSAIRVGWFDAVAGCDGLNVANRLGWRLPEPAGVDEPHRPNAEQPRTARAQPVSKDCEFSRERLLVHGHDRDGCEHRQGRRFFKRFHYSNSQIAAGAVPGSPVLVRQGRIQRFEPALLKSRELLRTPSPPQASVAPGPNSARSSIAIPRRQPD